MRKALAGSALVVLGAITAVTALQGQTIAQTSLSLDGARRVIAAAKAEALSKGAPGAVVAVVDNGGNLMALERLDGTFAAGANISIGKARTAALFKKPTRVFEELINKSRTAMTALADFTPLQGGVPIVVNGQIVGGVSGAASAQQDEDLALAGAAAVMEPRPAGTSGVRDVATPVSYVSADKVAAAFAKGMPLLETARYKVHASRRDHDGQAEVHARDTDVLYVLDGTAVLVTGGRVLNGEVTAEDEERGDAIANGETRALVKGDVVVIPNGVPHQFKNVASPFLYYVVKVTAPRSQS